MTPHPYIILYHLISSSHFPAAFLPLSFRLLHLLHLLLLLITIITIIIIIIIRQFHFLLLPPVFLVTCLFLLRFDDGRGEQTLTRPAQNVSLS